MSSNTVQRIISAVILALIAGLCVYSGKTSTRALIFLVGMIVNREIVENLFKRNMLSISHVTAQLLYVLGFGLYLNYGFLERPLVLLCLFINLGLIVYLFLMGMNNNLLSFVEKKTPWLSFLIILPSMLSLCYLLNFSSWRLFLALLLVVNFGMDTGAWFFGKMFGRHKLWPKISPKKTIEGLAGGMAVSGALGLLFVYSYFQTKTLWIFVPFSILGLLSQIGDLVQSKIKRQFNVKDSSSLIPGHGGMYDRIDSLIFVLPFFVLIMEYYQI